jgi:DNA-binding transcriptional LysR family regulator
VQGATSGKLRLGSVLSNLSPDLLAGALTCFRAVYPEVEVVLFEGTVREVGEWIEKGIIDVGFVPFPAQGIEGDADDN